MVQATTQRTTLATDRGLLLRQRSNRSGNGTVRGDRRIFPRHIAAVGPILMR